MNYTPQEVSLITQMLKDLATLKQNHPATDTWVDSATTDLVSLREFMMEMVHAQPKETE